MASIPQFTVLFLYSTALSVLGTLVVSEIPQERAMPRLQLGEYTPAKLEPTKQREEPIGQQELKVNFYATTYPNAEVLVTQEMKLVQAEDPTLMPSLIRLHFHDCFVRGCDGSVLLDSGSGTEEKDATISRNLRGFSTIDRLKKVVENECPKVVSCADILAMAAREAVFLSQGPRYDVETGRRDGSISIDNETYTNLPPVNGSITAIKCLYAKKNLTSKDLVVLSGAHSLGVSHCSSFSYRLYNYNGTGSTDLTLNNMYAEKLKQQCSPNDDNTIVQMGSGKPLTLSAGYFKSVQDKQVVFNSDEALLHNKATRAYVDEQASATSSQKFFNDFSQSMINMGRVQVLTGNKGVIRSGPPYIGPGRPYVPPQPPAVPDDDADDNNNSGDISGGLLYSNSSVNQPPAGGGGQPPALQATFGITKGGEDDKFLEPSHVDFNLNATNLHSNFFSSAPVNSFCPTVTFPLPVQSPHLYHAQTGLEIVLMGLTAPVPPFDSEDVVFIYPSNQSVDATPIQASFCPPSQIYDDSPPPGFDDTSCLSNPSPFTQPGSSSQVAFSEPRRSPRLKSKLSGPYTSAIDKAQRVQFASCDNPKSAKQKVTPAQTLADFLKNDDPPTMAQAELIILAAGFDLTPEIKKNLAEVGIV
ncbi:Peroxidase [Rhynchospora pubera]|uniref:peroxidase n=1 Tax=Rhynchospora pubera TaxID=906938 RepID=A0AAV8GVS3_9POAL|nr:Peroxidase [Rhynchospora pubera]